VQAGTPPEQDDTYLTTPKVIQTTT